MAQGLFITFEGSEGCGKSTQIKRLAGRFGQLQRPILLSREPGGTAIGEEIRQLLQFSSANRAMKPEAELLLFTASRAQLVREVIQPALESGTTVIVDRFLDSTTVYQGVARHIDAATVKFINEFAAGTCRPDLTFLMDMDSSVARQRILRRPARAGETHDRMEREPADFYAQVRAGYLALARAEPERISVVDASLGEAQIGESIWKIVQERFPRFAA